MLVKMEQLTVPEIVGTSTEDLGMGINVFLPCPPDPGRPRSPPTSRDNGRCSSSNDIICTGAIPIPRQTEGIFGGF